jgi:hypothetical protein
MKVSVVVFTTDIFLLLEFVYSLGRSTYIMYTFSALGFLIPSLVVSAFSFLSCYNSILHVFHHNIKLSVNAIISILLLIAQISEAR